MNERIAVLQHRLRDRNADYQSDRQDICAGERRQRV